MSTSSHDDERDGGDHFGVNSDGGSYDDCGEYVCLQVLFGVLGLTVIQAGFRSKDTSLILDLASQKPRKSSSSSRFVS